MKLEEVLHGKYYREQLEQPAPSQPLSPVSYADMSDSEKISFIQFLVSESYKKDEQIPSGDGTGLKVLKLWVQFGWS